MTDTPTRQRGPHPKDGRWFGQRHAPTLRRAVAELSWLRTRHYPIDTAVRFVGDRYQLHARQRIALRGASCGDDELQARLAKRVGHDAVHGRHLRIDGFNQLITIEAALSQALMVRGRDRVWRDLSQVSGSYKRVAQTAEAIALLGRAAAELGVASCDWCFDRPVSNSGRLCEMFMAAAADNGWSWTARTTDKTDPEVAAAPDIAVSSDSWILDTANAWFNLAGETVERYLPNAWRIDLGTDDAHPC